RRQQAALPKAGASSRTPKLACMFPPLLFRMQPAARRVIRAHLQQRRRLATAWEALAAARAEGAARGKRQQVGNETGNRRQTLLLRAAEDRDRAEQAARVRVERLVEEGVHRAALDDPAGVHYDHLI